MENNWLIPLSHDESDLVSLPTGTVAPPAVVKDFLRALELREEAYQTLKWTRLDDDPPAVKFHNKTTKKRPKTFSTISIKTSRMKGQNVVLKADRNHFSQMIVVAENREYRVVGLMFSLTHTASRQIKDAERLNRGASTSLQDKCLQGDTTHSNGENPCAVPLTRRASSSSWLASGNYSDTDICCKARHCM